MKNLSWSIQQVVTKKLCTCSRRSFSSIEGTKIPLTDLERFELETLRRERANVYRLSEDLAHLNTIHKDQMSMLAIVEEIKLLKKEVKLIVSAKRTHLVSTAEAKAMPTEYNEMPHDVLITLAALGDQDAREERVIREIMAVDNLSWTEAVPIFVRIANSNRKGIFFATLPYKVGIAGAITVAFASFPLTFDIHSVLYFNEHFVTQDIPHPKDLETPLEVAIWAWLWMGPPLSYVSFFLLCMQFSRAQMEKLGIKPYTAYYKSRRATRLCQEFPMYDPELLRMFSEGDSLTARAEYSTNADWKVLLDQTQPLAASAASATIGESAVGGVEALVQEPKELVSARELRRLANVKKSSM